MRYVPITKVKEGMILGSDLLDEIGRLLISKNTELTNEFISRLTEMGILGVYIDDEFSKGIEIEPIIPIALRSEGYEVVRKKNIDECKKISKKIVDVMLNADKISLDMIDLKSFDNYTYAHSVNVAVLACTIGFGMNLPVEDIEDIVLAGLLHDLGKLDIPEEILNKPTRLTPEEFALIKTHPTMSYDIISDRMDISSKVKHAVLSHHENYDGSGYPNGLSRDNILPIARIIHVADAYDALTSRRPYKDPYTAFASLEILQGARGTLYDPEVVNAFLKYVPIYPKGTLIRIDKNIEGIVIENSGEHNQRPIIRTTDLKEIDLSLPENAHYVITRPSEREMLNIYEDELQRSKMTKPIKKYKIMVLDSIGNTYHNLSKKLEYLYEFQQIVSDTSAEGYIRKYGYPDLIIVDVDDRNLENIERMKELNSKVSEKVPVIILGSYSDKETISLFRGMGIHNYILKPFRIVYVQSEIKRCVEGFNRFTE